MTIIHLGAIDVNNQHMMNTGKTLEKAYCDYVFQFLDNMISTGKRYLTTEESDNFQKGLKTTHRFMLVGLPDWGKDYEPKYAFSLTPDQYHNTRRRLNSAMKDNLCRLWNYYKGVIFTPTINNPERNGMHLAPQETVKYVKQSATV